MVANPLILLVATIIATGVAAQVLSDRYQIPSVVFLIVAGVLLGPEVFGVIRPAAFGDALSTIVGISVAIIVFEGAFHLDIDRIREAPREVIRLVTIGASIAFVGTAVATRYIVGTEWSVAFLVGALLVATGPTVITPIMDVVSVRDRVGAILETEGVVNDVTAAILAIVMFEVVMNPGQTSGDLVRMFASRVGIGVTAGILVAGVVWYLLQNVDLSPDNAVQNARLIVFAGAIGAYAIADALAGESGIAAVAVAGIIVGNADVPYEEEIETFKGDITLIVLSFVFITLAALLSFEELLEIGIPGIGVVLVMAIVIRPLGVFLSTFGDKITLRERAFISAVGPRGIIPASVATLFAIQLDLAGQSAAASTLVGVVFLAIFLTVVVQGGLAQPLARYLDVIPMRVLIIGGGTVGRALAERLVDRGENVVILEENQERVEQARNDGFRVEIGDGTDSDDLRDAGIEDAKIVVSVTGDDDTNLLVSQLAESKFDVETVIARANNPENIDAFEDLGVRTVSSTMATAWGIDNMIERPALAKWMTEIGRSGDVQETEVTADVHVGKTIDEFDDQLPNGVIIALISRDGSTEVPDPTTRLKRGDHLTFLGRRDGVREALQLCHPHD